MRNFELGLHLAFGVVTALTGALVAFVGAMMTSVYPVGGMMIVSAGIITILSGFWMMRARVLSRDEVASLGVAAGINLDDDKWYPARGMYRGACRQAIRDVRKIVERLGPLEGSNS